MYIHVAIYLAILSWKRETCVQIPFFKERKEGREERSHVKQNIIDHLLFYTAYSSKGSFLEIKKCKVSSEATTAATANACVHT